MPLLGRDLIKSQQFTAVLDQAFVGLWIFRLDPFVAPQVSLAPVLMFCRPLAVETRYGLGREAGGPGAGSIDNADPISPVEMPLRQSHGNAASMDLALRSWGATRAARRVAGLPSFARTFGTLTLAGPIPVGTARSG